jgi:exonuclease SbcC
MLARAAQEQESARAKLSEAQAALAELPSVEKALREAEARRTGLDSRQRTLLAREGELAGRLKRVQEVEQESHAVRRKLQEAAEEVGLYRELAQAFGGRGVQAMLIESVLPDLEREANELLARMTQNRMHVKLETQREARSRKGAEPIETLEIKIADELGTRSYELYSGGEAFRINLALRIALSRILAERSGAPLPTLFIDEGFGTQDAAGRESIVDVIRAIEPLFKKIIVVTHLDEVKDAFPVRIEVRKTDGQATFSVA